MAQTALNSPLFNGRSDQGQALLVLPQAPSEALPPGVDAQSAQRMRLAAQGAINSLTISRSPNQQSVLAQVSSISVSLREYVGVSCICRARSYSASFKWL